MSNDELRDRVRERYATVARSVREGGGSCCGYSEVEPGLGESLVRGDCSDVEKRELPQAAAEASLGCGNPVALATLSLGEVVLDLGSGGGIDVLLSARRVGPEGKAYGLDMTDEMLRLAWRNQVEAGVENVEFLKGEIEAVPLPDSHVDVVISNCVINLSTEKEKALAEAFRVLKPGGRFAVSDMVFVGDKGELPGDLIRDVELWAGCVSGALEKDEYEALLAGAGFEDVAVEVTHVYEPEAAAGADAEALRRVPIASAFVRGRKPEGS